MKVGIIILCRYSSTRLPGKILMEIEGKSVLENIHARLLQSKSVDQVIIATSDDTSDDVIESFCNSKQIPCYRGSLKNVSERFMKCAQEFKLDYAIRINGDNLLIDLDLLSNMIAQSKNEALDFCSNVPGRTFPYGMSIEIVKTDFYAKVFQNFNNDRDLEHVTIHLYENDAYGKYKFIENTSYPNLKGVKLAIDTIEDFENAKLLAEALPGFPTDYNIEDISKLIQA